MKQFMVIRLRFIGEEEIHSMEYFDDELNEKYSKELSDRCDGER